MQVHTDSLGQGERKNAERADVTGELDVPG